MDLYIHIGYPKTGTTTLQDELFSHHDDIFYLNKHVSDKFFYEVFFARENHIKRNLKSFQDDLRKINFPKNKTVVLSNESFTSYGTFFVHRPEPLIQSIDPNTIARKLAMIFTDTGIFDNVYVFGAVRKQDDLMKSMYAQVYNRYFKKFSQTANFKAFLKYSLENRDMFILDALQYNSVFEQYESLFGPANVKVLIYEQMKYKEQEFYKELSSYLNIDVQKTIELTSNKNLNKKSSSKGYSTDKKSLVKILAKWKKKILGDKKTGLSTSSFYTFLSKFKMGGKQLTDINIDEKTSAELEAFFKEENQKLAQRHNLDLKQYKYFV